MYKSGIGFVFVLNARVTMIDKAKRKIAGKDLKYRFGSKMQISFKIIGEVRNVLNVSDVTVFRPRWSFFLLPYGFIATILRLTNEHEHPA